MKMKKGLKMVLVAGVFVIGLFAGGSSTYAFELGSKANLDASTSVVGQLLSEQTLFETELNINGDAEISLTTEEKTSVNVKNKAEATSEISIKSKGEKASKQTESKKSSASATAKTEAEADVLATSETQFDTVTLATEPKNEDSYVNACSREEIIAESNLSVSKKAEASTSIDANANSKTSINAAVGVEGNVAETTLTSVELQKQAELSSSSDWLDLLIKMTTIVGADLNLN